MNLSWISGLTLMTIAKVLAMNGGRSILMVYLAIKNLQVTPSGDQIRNEFHHLYAIEFFCWLNISSIRKRSKRTSAVFRRVAGVQQQWFGRSSFDIANVFQFFSWLNRRGSICWEEIWCSRPPTFIQNEPPHRPSISNWWVITAFTIFPPHHGTLHQRKYLLR